MILKKNVLIHHGLITLLIIIFSYGKDMESQYSFGNMHGLEAVLQSKCSPDFIAS